MGEPPSGKPPGKREKSPLGEEAFEPSAASVMLSAAAAAPATAPKDPAQFEKEVAFITGVKADGSIVTSPANYFERAHKWGATVAGTGATITYAFDSRSAFSSTEKATFVTALHMWSAVANVTFEPGPVGSANVKLIRGRRGSGAYEDGSSSSSPSGIRQNRGQHIINIETSVWGFDLSGSPTRAGGYGLSTIIHEAGHLLGLGHGGDYNGDVRPRTQQFSPYDELMWTTMSYIDFTSTNAKFRSSYDYSDTDWGSRVSSPHSVMPLDIIAIQRLYGVAASTPFDGDDVFGFHTTVTGDLKKIYDFTQNKTPVVTLYDQGTDNTLDVSGFRQDARIDLRAGFFSSVAGFVNNIAIAFGTVIETAVTGSGDDRIDGNAADNVLRGGGGSDRIDGGDGIDTAVFERSSTEYNITRSGDSIVVAGKTASSRAADGTDTLTNVEYLRFANGALNVSRLREADREAAGPSAPEPVFRDGGAGNDDLSGRAGNDVLSGGDGSDNLYGRLGQDLLIGGTGDDYLVGGGGNDTFRFGRGSGRDTIADFHHTGGERDRIDLRSFDFDSDSFIETRVAVNTLAHSSTVFLGGGNQLLVSGITDLSLKDFLLA